MLPTIATGNVGSALAGEFEVANSLRFDDGSSDSLSRTPSSTTNQRTFTISFWIKSSTAGGTIFSTGDYSAGDGYFNVRLSSSGRLVLDDYAQGAGTYNNRWVTPSSTPFRDPSAWYHMVISIDSTQATLSDRVNFYINGENIDSLFTDNASGTPSQNADFHINYNKVHQIGRDQNNSDYFDGYIAEFVLIDGQQLTPTSFGEFDEDTNIWKPKNVSGLTFGTNGFYLDFENSGSLGADVSGNGNNFTVNNLTSIDQTTDTPTNNFATMNPLDNSVSAGTFSEGNLKIVYSGSNGSGVALTSTMALTTGKWYFETKLTSTNDTGNRFGITDINAHSNAVANRLGLSTYSYGYADSDGKIYNNNDSGTAYGSTFAAGDIIGVYLDLDNNKLYFSKNGTLGSSTGYSITDPTNVSNGHYFFAVGLNSGSGTSTFECNFGGTQTYSISSGVSDDNGYGNFEYSPNITGDSESKKFYALCTKNLAEYG